MKNLPVLVSIIMPVYNSAASLEESVNSVRDQTVQSWELLLVDDQSTDGSWELALELAAQDSRIRTFRLEANSGSGVARNRAIEEAQGRFIAFLDSDDLWRKEKLEVQVAAMMKYDWAFCFSDYNKFETGVEGSRPVLAPQQVNYKDVLRTCHIGCLTAVYDCQKLGKRYMPTIRRRQDWALWLSILKEGYLAHNVGRVLADYRVGHGGISADKWSVAQDSWQFYRKTLGLNLFTSSWYFISYAVHGLRKHLI